MTHLQRKVIIMRILQALVQFERRTTISELRSILREVDRKLSKMEHKRRGTSVQTTLFSGDV